MNYLVSQIAVFLTLAALLGAAVGWLLRRPGRTAPPDLSAELAAANQKIERLERSLAVYESARPISAPSAEAAGHEAR